MGGEPGIGQLLVFGLADDEVDEIHHQAGNHQHLQVKAVPVAPQVKGNLLQRANESIKQDMMNQYGKVSQVTSLLNECNIANEMN